VSRELQLERALRRLLEEVESLEDYTLTSDVEPYKAQACWDDAIREASNLLYPNTPWTVEDIRAHEADMKRKEVA
jgi:hypothetical protein